MLAEPILAAIVLNTIPEYYPISVTKVSLSKIKTMRVWDLTLEKATLIEEEDESMTQVVTSQDETVKKEDVHPTCSEENYGKLRQQQPQRNRTLRWQPSMGDQQPTSPTIVRTASTASSSCASPSTDASASPFSAWYSLAVSIADQMLCCSYSGNQVGVEQTIDHVVPLRRQGIDRKAQEVEHQHDTLRKNQSSTQVLSSVKSNASSSSFRKSFENVGKAPSPASPRKTFVLVQESKNKGDVKQPKQQRQQRSRGSRRHRERPSPEMSSENDDCSEAHSRCDTVTTASISSDCSSARSWNTLPTKVSSCDDDPTEGEDDFHHSQVRQEASNHYQPGRFLPASPAWQYLPSRGDSLRKFSVPLTHSHSSSHSSRSKRTQPWEMSIEFRRTFTDPESAQQELYNHVQSESLQHAQQHYQHSRQIALYADV